MLWIFWRKIIKIRGSFSAHLGDSHLTLLYHGELSRVIHTDGGYFAYIAFTIFSPNALNMKVGSEAKGMEKG